jgi:hypothetical protein
MAFLIPVFEWKIMTKQKNNSKTSATQTNELNAIQYL